MWETAAFDVHGISGKNHVLQMLELDRHPDIYVAFVNEQEYQNDALGAADILIFPDGTVEKYKAALPPHEARYKA